MSDTEKQSTEKMQGNPNPSTDALTTALIVEGVAQGAVVVGEAVLTETVAENILEPAVDVVVEVGSSIVGFISDIVS